jgi:hypothetical protein
MALPLRISTSAHCACATVGELAHQPSTVIVRPAPPVLNCWYTPPLMPVPVRWSRPATFTTAPSVPRSLQTRQPVSPCAKSPFATRLATGGAVVTVTDTSALAVPPLPSLTVRVAV